MKKILIPLIVLMFVTSAIMIAHYSVMSSANKLVEDPYSTEYADALLVWFIFYGAHFMWLLGSALLLLFCLLLLLQKSPRSIRHTMLALLIVSAVIVPTLLLSLLGTSQLAHLATAIMVMEVVAAVFYLITVGAVIATFVLVRKHLNNLNPEQIPVD